MRILFLIPARGGSKGLPNKNIKNLANKPLIQYTIDQVKELKNNSNDICISTDSIEIIKCVEELGIKVPFVRPEIYSSDTSTSESVILHAINWYKNSNIYFDVIVLLQPTSPMRTLQDIKNAISLYHENLDMVVSVKKTRSNPYFNLYEENENGYLSKSKVSNFTRRQDCPEIYELNGAIYVLNVKSFLEKGFSNLNKIIKYEMCEESSVDIDTIEDFLYAEKLIKNVLKN